MLDEKIRENNNCINSGGGNFNKNIDNSDKYDNSNKQKYVVEENKLRELLNRLYKHKGNGNHGYNGEVSRDNNNNLLH